MTTPMHGFAFDRALELVLDHAARLPAPERIEIVSLLEARGRVLARPVIADRDQPPFDRSTRDGFAVRAADFSSGAHLRVIGSVRAGEIWAGPAIGSLEAVTIMTGAPVPAGTDAVAMIEHCLGWEHTLHAADGRTLRAGENVVPRGSEARAGETVLRAGGTVGAAEIALAAACGCASLPVFGRVRVAVAATGDELVEVDQMPGPQQIRNSNSYALAALVETAGAEAVRLPITPDLRDAVAATLLAAREADLIVFSGGVSMGEYDLVEECLHAAGAEFFFTGVRMQPGKPVVFGRLPERDGLAAKYFFGLPGNPISTQVTFHCFVEPLLRAMSGVRDPKLPWALATLAEDVAGKPGLTRLLPARMEDTVVRLVGWQGSGDLAANARANCYALLPADRDGFAAGEPVRVLLR